MHIIFGDHYKQLPDSYTVLELDTFQSPSSGKTMTTYCVVETIPLAEFPMAGAHRKIHADLISAYRGRHWNYCKQAIEQLMGKWNQELDSFYSDLLLRVKTNQESTLTDDWTGVIKKEFTPV
jgi:hypothetical protein